MGSRHSGAVKSYDSATALCYHISSLLAQDAGAKIGKRAEISTVDHITADLLSVEEGSFVADSASVGPAVVRNGTVNVGKQ